MCYAVDQDHASGVPRRQPHHGSRQDGQSAVRETVLTDTASDTDLVIVNNRDIVSNLINFVRL